MFLRKILHFTPVIIFQTCFAIRSFYIMRLLSYFTLLFSVWYCEALWILNSRHRKGFGLRWLHKNILPLTLFNYVSRSCLVLAFFVILITCHSFPNFLSLCYLGFVISFFFLNSYVFSWFLSFALLYDFGFNILSIAHSITHPFRFLSLAS